MIGDTDLKISKAYGMLPASTSGTSEGRTPADNFTVPQRLRRRPGQKDQTDPGLSDDPPAATSMKSCGDRLAPANRQASCRDAGELEARRGRHPHRRDHDDEAKKLYPGGYKQPKPYIRIAPQPK